MGIRNLEAPCIADVTPQWPVHVDRLGSAVQGP